MQFSFRKIFMFTTLTWIIPACDQILTKWNFSRSPSATSSSTQSMAPARTISQPVQIPEIPPFRKHENQHSNYPPHGSIGQIPSSTSVSPPKISEIPPFKQRKSKDYAQVEHFSQDGSHPEHQLTIGPSGGAEWTRRLKVAEQSPIHRSTDCIVSKELGTSSDSELLKPAPSWTNVALKTTEQAAGTSELELKIFYFKISFQILLRRECSVGAESNDGRGTQSGDCREEVKTQTKAREERENCRHLLAETEGEPSEGGRKESQGEGWRTGGRESELEINFDVVSDWRIVDYFPIFNYANLRRTFI